MRQIGKNGGKTKGGIWIERERRRGEAEKGEERLYASRTQPQRWASSLDRENTVGPSGLCGLPPRSPTQWMPLTRFRTRCWLFVLFNHSKIARTLPVTAAPPPFLHPPGLQGSLCCWLSALPGLSSRRSLFSSLGLGAPARWVTTPAGLPHGRSLCAVYSKPDPR